MNCHPTQQVLEDPYTAGPARSDMFCASAAEPGDQSIHYFGDRDAPVGVAHKFRLAGLLGYGDIRLGQIGEAPHGVGKVIHTLPRADIGVEVDEGDSVLTTEDGVVRSHIAMTDGLLASARRKRGSRVVERFDQCSGTTDPAVGKPVRAGAGHIARHERQDLTTAVVVSQRTRSAGKADISQVLQKRVNIA